MQSNISQRNLYQLLFSAIKQKSSGTITALLINVNLFVNL